MQLLRLLGKLDDDIWVNCNRKWKPIANVNSNLPWDNSLRMPLHLDTGSTARLTETLVNDDWVTKTYLSRQNTDSLWKLVGEVVPVQHASSLLWGYWNARRYNCKQLNQEESDCSLRGYWYDCYNHNPSAQQTFGPNYHFRSIQAAKTDPSIKLSRPDEIICGDPHQDGTIHPLIKFICQAVVRQNLEGQSWLAIISSSSSPWVCDIKLSVNR